MYKEKLVPINGEPFIIEMMYARPDNMTGRAVYQEIGFGNQAWVHPELKAKLLQLIPVLQSAGLKMKICDAYRPPLAHQIMKEIIPFPGFFASSPERSQHCHGTAVDVVLTNLQGQELVYPTRVDGYDAALAAEVQNGKMENFTQHLKKAARDYTSDDPALAEGLRNRDYLRGLMEGIGLESIPLEWWHFDLPRGCSEAYPMVGFE